MELEKLVTNLLNRLDRIDEDSKSTIIEDIINKLSHQIDHLKSDLSDVATLFDLLKVTIARCFLPKTFSQHLEIEKPGKLLYIRI